MSLLLQLLYEVKFGLKLGAKGERLLGVFCNTTLEAKGAFAKVLEREKGCNDAIYHCWYRFIGFKESIR